MESLNPLLILSKRVPLSLLPPDPDNLDNLDTTKIRLEFPQRLWLHGRELLLHLNEQITEVLFLEKDVSRRVGQKVALTGGLLVSQRLVYHVWQYSGGLVENINYKLQSADTDCTVQKDQSIGQRLVGLRYLWSDFKGLLFKNLTNRHPDLLAEIACLDTLWENTKNGWRAP